jgi:hypothetical protein
MRTFYSDLDLGKQAEREMFIILASRNDVTAIKMTDWTKVGYDLAYQMKGKTKSMEVKSLGGGYPTGVVEVWSDDKKTKRPHWLDADYIAFKDRSKNKWFMYNVKEFTAWLFDCDDSQLCRANNGCKDDSGWIRKFKWAGAPGFLGTVKGL